MTFLKPIQWASILAAPVLWVAIAVGGEAELLSGPYVVNLATNRATVCWQTTAKAPGAVRYRPADGGDWKDLAGPETRFHSIDVTGLQAGKRYVVKAASGSKELGELTFSAAPAQAESLVFYVYGDTRSYPRDHAKVADALAADAKQRQQYTFVMHIGDFAQAGSDETGLAREFFEPAQAFLRMLPLVPVEGNHETGKGLYSEYFPALKDDPAVASPAGDVCLDYGPVRIVTMDQYRSMGSDAQRLKWLGARLAEASNQWRVVAFHEPMYSSGSHGSNESFRRLVEQTLVDGRVHAVFAGHDHDYERTLPQSGIVHFVTGGGGAPLRRLRGDAKPFSAKFAAAHHFLAVDVNKERMVVQVYEVTDSHKTQELDKVEIPWVCDWK